MASRSKRAQLAHNTVGILERGEYTDYEGETHQIARDVEDARTNTRLYSHTQLDELVNQSSPKTEGQVDLEVTGEGAVGAARRLATLYSNVTILNFASAKNPCGGMLGGSRAQEESIGVCSSLHSCLTQGRLQAGYYRLHKENSRDGRYSHTMIWSPQVVLLRDEPAFQLAKPLRANIITSPAINLGVVFKKGSTMESCMPEMRQRMEYVIKLAASHSTEALVLGAWGCGVFKWPPKVVADMFRELLVEKGLINNFKHIVFALASDKEFHPQFEKFDFENFNTFTDIFLNT